ncbi:MAG: PQQ-binding-like beta-propeller repeat protein [Bryobacterales bacterium]|nr:PQQ-binding-like beta-propeller repeat protein [Bryobacterales bacterium]
MNRRRFLQVGAAAPLLNWACSKPAPETQAARAPRLMAQDKQQVAIVNPDGSVDWSWPNGTTAHDLHLLANGNVLVPTARDALAEVTPEKDTVWEWKSRPASDEVDKIEIHGFERLDSGLTMIAETGNKRIIEVDRDGQVQHEIKLQVDNPDSHRDTRLVRSTPDGTYLVAHEKDGAVREYEADGKVVWEYKLTLNGEPTPTHRGHGTSVYSAYRLPGGNTLIGGGNNNRVLEVNPGGEIVWSLESHEIPGIQLFWVTQLHALANGNIVVTNTHAEGETPQIFEVNRDKELVWGFLDWETFGNDLCANILLDAQGDFVR